MAGESRPETDVSLKAETVRLVDSDGEEFEITGNNNLSVNIAEDTLSGLTVASLTNTLSRNVDEIGGQAQSAVDVANQIDELTDALAGFGGSDELRVNVQNNNAGTKDTNIVEFGGQSQSAVDVANQIDQLADALTTFGGAGDSLQVDSNNALDASAANVPLDDGAGNQVADANPLPIDLRTNSAGNVDIDIAETSASPLDVSAAEVDVDTATNTVGLLESSDQPLDVVASAAGGLAVEQQTPVQVEDAAGTNIDPLGRQDASPVTGSTSTDTTDVSLTLGDYRKDVDWFVDVSGSATLTVEVRTSGGTWRTLDTVTYSSATTEVEQYSTAFAEMRASVDSNLNTLEGSAKGV